MPRPGQSGRVGRAWAALRRAAGALDGIGRPALHDRATAYLVNCGRDAWRRRERLDDCPFREPRQAYAWRYGWMSAAKDWRAP